MYIKFVAFSFKFLGPDSWMHFLAWLAKENKNINFPVPYSKSLNMEFRLKFVGHVDFLAEMSKCSIAKIALIFRIPAFTQKL